MYTYKYWIKIHVEVNYKKEFIRLEKVHRLDD